MSSDDSFIGIKKVLAKVDLSDTWLYHLIKQGKFPGPVSYGHCHKWSLNEVNAWMDERKRARGNKPKRVTRPDMVRRIQAMRSVERKPA